MTELECEKAWIDACFARDQYNLNEKALWMGDHPTAEEILNHWKERVVFLIEYQIRYWWWQIKYYRRDL